MSRRSRRSAIAALALAAGVVSWAWGRLGWPARGLVRGHLGDVAAAALAYALIGAVTGASRKTCAALALAVASMIEVAQRHAPAEVGAARELALGARFDPWDLLAYVVGVALAAAADTGFRGGDGGGFRLRGGRGRGYGPPP